MSEILQVVTTTDTKEKASEIARTLVDARLAACAQVEGPIESTYRWQGAVETAQEWRCVAKTTTARYAAVEAAIREMHSYDEPEIIATPITHGSSSYLAWIKKETELPK